VTDVRNRLEEWQTPSAIEHWKRMCNPPFQGTKLTVWSSNATGHARSSLGVVLKRELVNNRSPRN
jgi:hypothetical protein